jgi:hypothetical protein
MTYPHTVLWCKLLGRLVTVTVRPVQARAAPVPGLPKGLEVAACEDKDHACFGTGCPLTTDAGGSPFGQLGELSFDGERD